jgi:hypothetical protein
VDDDFRSKSWRVHFVISFSVETVSKSDGFWLHPCPSVENRDEWGSIGRDGAKVGQPAAFIRITKGLER